MEHAVDSVRTMVPALLFLCAGVPLAALLDRLGFFDSLAISIERRYDHIPVVVLWWLAAATTVVLNLDTTIVLLTPLYIRIARRAGQDPFVLALVPLLLAAFASSVLPISNLTTLVAADHFDLGVAEVFTHLAPVSATAALVGWLSYRRRHPTTVAAGHLAPVDRRALTIGSMVVAGLLAGFVVGPAWGVEPWVVAVVADLVLVAVTRYLPWRDVPVGTALGVAAVAAVVALVVPVDVLAGPLATDHPVALGALVVAGAGVANLVNNLPAVFVALGATEAATAGTWAWLAGVNTGSVLLPLGSLANILWWRVARSEGVAVDLRRYAAAVVPIALPALVVSAAVLAATSTLWS